jgi:hypothetical protein
MQSKFAASSVLPLPRVHSDLWIRAQRARPIHNAVAEMRRHNLVGCGSLFHPSFERPQHVERVGTWTAGAMIDAGRPEEANEILRASKCDSIFAATTPYTRSLHRDNAFIVVDG